MAKRYDLGDLSRLEFAVYRDLFQGNMTMEDARSRHPFTLNQLLDKRFVRPDGTCPELDEKRRPKRS